MDVSNLEHAEKTLVVGRETLENRHYSPRLSPTGGLNFYYSRNSIILMLMDLMQDDSRSTPLGLDKMGNVTARWLSILHPPIKLPPVASSFPHCTPIQTNYYLFTPMGMQGQIPGLCIHEWDSL
jgi:hypothetical protein